jgi:hypothetical protein
MNLFIPELVKIKAKRTLLILHFTKIEVKQIIFFPQIGMIKTKGTLLIPEMRKIEA